MNRLEIPKARWMRMRSRGSYVYAFNEGAIYWTKNPQIPDGAPVYCVAWGTSQRRLMASKVIKHKAKGATP